MAIWNPSDKDSSITLSSKDTVFTHSGATDGGVRSNWSYDGTGPKRYWEIVCDSDGSTDNIFVGLAKASSPLNNYVGFDADGYSYSSNNGQKYNSGSGASFGASFGAGDIIGVAANLSGGKIWFAKNNVWQASGDPTGNTNEAFSGLSGTYYPMCSGNNNGAGTANFKATSELTYAPPQGFQAIGVEPLNFDHIFNIILNFENINLDIFTPGVTPTPIAPSDIPIPDFSIRPKAYVLFQNWESLGTSERKTWYVLATATAFNISNSKNNLLGSFSVTINKADLWNSRTATYEDVIEGHLQKLVQIYYSSNNGVSYSMLFEGQPNATPETYTFNGQELITISGVSNASRMQRSFFEPQIDFSGTTKVLMERYVFKTMSDTSGGYILNFGDGYTHTDIDVGYTTALQAIQDLLKVLGPTYWHFMDYENTVSTLIIGTRPSSTEFSFNDSNMISFKLNPEMGIITKCEVIGIDEDAIYTADAASTVKFKHGDNILSISSGLITTWAQAVALASTYVSDAQEMQKTYEIQTILNPFVQIGHTCKIASSEASLYTNGGEKIIEYQHSYQYGSIPITTIKGIYSKLL
jgi:hypothetical protein